MSVSALRIAESMSRRAFLRARGESAQQKIKCSKGGGSVNAGCVLRSAGNTLPFPSGRGEGNTTGNGLFPPFPCRGFDVGVSPALAVALRRFGFAGVDRQSV